MLVLLETGGMELLAPVGIAFFEVTAVFGLTLGEERIAEVREIHAVVLQFLFGIAPADQVREAAALKPALDVLLLLHLVEGQGAGYVLRLGALLDLVQGGETGGVIRLGTSLGVHEEDFGVTHDHQVPLDFGGRSTVFGTIEALPHEVARVAGS